MSVYSKRIWRQELEKAVCFARAAAAQASQWPSPLKKRVLVDVANRLRKRVSWLLAQNAKDIMLARKCGLPSAMMDRLTLTPSRIRGMADGVLAVAALKDPIGVIQANWVRPNGLRIQKVTVPLGVILIIYESRPNVTVECAALCLKSSNAVILRGGRESMASNKALVRIFHESLRKFRLSPHAVGLVRTTDYGAVDFLLKQEGRIDLVIPRGGEKLIRRVVEKSRVPVIKHYQGICHVFIDKKADLKKALAITINAKLHRPGVCNAMETLLVHKDIAEKFLPLAGEALRQGGCEVRGDALICRLIPFAKRAKGSDFGREFLDKIVAIRAVKDIKEAIRHIETHSSRHTDAIVTEDKKAAGIFQKSVDSSSVMVNASTRFSDGFEYGFGAEIGISTDKIHARGPMGLEGLTSYKYLVEGRGHIRT